MSLSWEVCSLICALIIRDGSVANAAQTEAFIVSTTIRSRFAETTVNSLFMNNEQHAKQVEFKVLLPHEAFVTQFCLNIDGTWHDGIVEEKEKASRQFAIAKELGVTAGIFESEGISHKSFKTKTYIEPGVEIQFRLVYQQLLRRIDGKYRHEIILLGTQLTEELSVEAHICESEEIYNVRALPIISGDGIFVKPSVELEQTHKNSASLYFLPTNNGRYMKSLLNSGGRFVVEYEMNPEENGELIVHNRNFIQFFSPHIDIKPRRIVFLLDVSGSMNTDDRIMHLKTAMFNLVRKLTEQDRFALISFDTNFTVWQMNSIAMNPGLPTNINSAVRFIKGLYPKGYTEFYEPLKKAIKILEQDIGTESSEVDPKTNYIVLVTDGRPKASPEAEVDENQWLHNISRINDGRFSIHAIGLGDAVDRNVMSQLTAENSGTWQQLSPNINTGVQLQNYLEDLGIALLSNISLSYPKIVTSRTIMPPAHMGGEYMITGQFRDASSSRKKVIVTEELSGVTIMSMEFVTEDTNLECAHVDPQSAANFTEKAHGLATVMDLLRRIDRSQNEKIRNQLEAQATELAKRHHLVTPLTSMVVFRPGDRKKIEIQYTTETQESATITPAPKLARRLSSQVPGWGFQGDPHIFVHLQNNITACFEFPGKRGQIFNFVHDPLSGVTVNGKAAAPPHEHRKGTLRNLYITEVAVILKKEKILIKMTPTNVTVQDTNTESNVLHLPLTNIEDYERPYGPIMLTIGNATRRSTLVSVFLGPGNALELRFEMWRPGVRSSAHINLEIFGIWNQNTTGAGGILGCYSKVLSSIIKASGSNKDEKVKMELRGHSKIRVKEGKIRLRYGHEYSRCWHVMNVLKLLGYGPHRFKVNSLEEEPDGLYKLG